MSSGPRRTWPLSFRQRRLLTCTLPLHVTVQSLTSHSFCYSFTLLTLFPVALSHALLHTAKNLMFFFFFHPESVAIRLLGKNANYAQLIWLQYTSRFTDAQTLYPSFKYKHV